MREIKTGKYAAATEKLSISITARYTNNYFAQNKINTCQRNVLNVYPTRSRKLKASPTDGDVKNISVPTAVTREPKRWVSDCIRNQFTLWRCRTHNLNLRHIRVMCYGNRTSVTDRTKAARSYRRVQQGKWKKRAHTTDNLSISCVCACVCTTALPTTSGFLLYGEFMPSRVIYTGGVKF